MRWRAPRGYVADGCGTGRIVAGIATITGAYMLALYLFVLVLTGAL